MVESGFDVSRDRGDVKISRIQGASTGCSSSVTIRSDLAGITVCGPAQPSDLIQ